jgi:hypothetical protein
MACTMQISTRTATYVMKSATWVTTGRDTGGGSSDGIRVDGILAKTWA